MSPASVSKPARKRERAGCIYCPARATSVVVSMTSARIVVRAMAPIPSTVLVVTPIALIPVVAMVAPTVVA